MNSKIAKFAKIVLSDGLLTMVQIENLATESKNNTYDLLYWANQIRIEYFANKIKVCSIVPGRLGGCDQDCTFCAQSARYNTHISKKPKTLSDKEIYKVALKTKQNGVPNFGIVYSGKAITEKELKRIEKLITRIKSELNLDICASLGMLNPDQAKRLADAGLSRYNHNLETSHRHFSQIVTTHNYSDRVKTIEAAKQAGLGICAGGIFGIGESDTDRIDMALELRRLAPDTIPMNFLHPIEGTPLGNIQTLNPLEILRIIALYRFILPQTNLKIAGGRVLNLRDLQSWIFYAGATSILSGNYLTTAGRPVKDDIQMIKDLNLEPQKL